MTRVLLTGAGGFVGHHTLEHLLVTTDWEVVCTDSFKHAGKVDRISEVLETHPEQANRATVVTQDLTVPISDQTAAKIGPIDAIISMASESHVDRSILFPVEFVQNNVSLVLNLLEFTRKYAPDAIFLQVSTDEVYGPAPQGHNHAEWETNYPSNPYSASKSAQDSIAYSYWRTYGLKLISSHTMNILGERQDPEKFVPMVIKKVLSGDTVQIHASEDGIPGSRYYLHARNQADALIFLLKTYLGFPVSNSTNSDMDVNQCIADRVAEGESLVYVDGVIRPPKYHIVGEKEVNNLEMAEMIAKFAEKPLYSEMVNFHSSRPGHDLRYALDGSKITDLGWTAPFSLEESLKRTVDWTMEHEEWLL